MTSPFLPGTSRVVWLPSWRIVPSRFPPVQLFERVADPEDLDSVVALESLTNERLRARQVQPDLVKAQGPGGSAIMAAFAYRNPDGSRFSDGSFGVYYAARDLDTAVAESVYHRERFMRASHQSCMELDMRVYLADLAGDFHDIRSRPAALATVYDPGDYTAGQRLAASLRAAGANGIVYVSVRRAGGECAAVFRPQLLSNCRQERHLCYVWDGQRVSAIYEKRSLQLRPVKS